MGYEHGLIFFNLAASNYVHTCAHHQRWPETIVTCNGSERHRRSHCMRPLALLRNSRSFPAIFFLGAPLSHATRRLTENLSCVFLYFPLNTGQTNTHTLTHTHTHNTPFMPLPVVTKNGHEEGRREGLLCSSRFFFFLAKHSKERRKSAHPKVRCRVRQRKIRNEREFCRSCQERQVHARIARPYALLEKYGNDRRIRVLNIYQVACTAGKRGKRTFLSSSSRWATIGRGGRAARTKGRS